ncbi:MAG: TIGR04076 family protein [Staphylococcus sp.]|nr:TIGR04076 family protein [Staphylococcus sp.]
MNRRYFCKIASLAAVAAGLSPAKTLAGTNIEKSSTSLPTSPRLAATCRLTILRRECHHDLQALFLDDPDSGPCPNFTSGDEFHFTSGSSRPDGFCPRLWDALCAHSPENACASSLNPSTVLLSCPDGTRPVIVRADFSI